MPQEATSIQELKERLARSDARFQALAKGMRDGIMIALEDGKTYWMNDQFAAIFGYAKEELIGHGPEKVFAAAELQAIKGRINKRRNGDGFEIQYEAVAIKKDGSPIDVEITDKTIVFDGKPAIFVAIRDIQRRKKFERELDVEKKRMCQYLEVAAFMIVVVDAQQKVAFINKRGSQILGFPEEYVLGKNWFDTFLSSSIREKTRSFFQDALTGKRVLSPDHPVENPVLTKSGEERIIAWRNTILKNDQGVIIGTLSSGEDVTGRVHKEQELSAAHVMLEKKNAALSTVIEHVEYEKKKVKQQILQSIERLIIPLMRTLHRKGSHIDKKYIALIERNLNDITTSFGSILSQDALQLTARELEVSNLVKSGMANKEIARELRCSLRTVETHRLNIRKKLGLRRKHKKLNAYL